jgi:hypothetical protein
MQVEAKDNKQTHHGSLTQHFYVICPIINPTIEISNDKN